MSMIFFKTVIQFFKNAHTLNTTADIIGAVLYRRSEGEKFATRILKISGLTNEFQLKSLDKFHELFPSVAKLYIYSPIDISHWINTQG